MNDRNKYLASLIKKLNIIFWILVVFTVFLTYKEYSYLNDSAPTSGNWTIASDNTTPNDYIYDWISYINFVLIIISGAVTFAIFQIKKLFKDMKKDIKS